MTQENTAPDELIDLARQAISDAESAAHDLAGPMQKREARESRAALFDAIRAAIAARPSVPPAMERFRELHDDKSSELADETPLERLRFFCALAMKGQDWLDVEPFFDAVAASVAPAAAPSVEPADTVLLAEARYVQTYMDGLAIPTRSESDEPLSLVARINVMTARCVQAKKDLAESRFRTAAALEERLNRSEAENEKLRLAAPAATTPEGDKP